MDKLKGKAISCKIAGKYFLPAVIALAFSTGAMQASEKGRTSFDVESVTHSQQERELTGVVTDAKGEPIIGANVVIKGTTQGSITDLDGRFVLQVPENAVLQISYIGYVMQEVEVGNKTSVTILLKEDSQALEEVVIVGFGAQKKVNLTGSVSSVDSEKLSGMPATNVTSMLQGKLPGVAITQSSGLPGREKTSIRIRGIGTMNNSDPMVLVDGLESSMDDVNPNDIESVSVLKDAAASSIYGTRAANGVILITTKRGKTGKPSITYNGYVGFQKDINRQKHLSSAQYAELYNEGLRNEGASPAYSAEDIQKYRDGSDPDNYPNTDWMDALLQGSGFTHNHNISLNGGTEATRYAVSLGYYDQLGLTKNTDYDRYNVRINLDSKVNDRLSFGVNSSLSYRDISVPTTPYNNSDDLAQFFRQANRIPNMYVNKYSDGSWGRHIDGNPIAWLEAGGKGTTQAVHALGSAFAELKIIEGLTLKGIAGVDYDMKEEKIHIKEIRYGNGTVQGPNSVNDMWERKMTVTLQALLNYEKQIGAHNIKGMLGVSRESYRYHQTKAYRKNFPSNDLDELNGGSTDGWSNEGKALDSNIGSYFGRINYDYASKYIVSLNYRRDGYSALSEKNRWGNFGGVSAAWRVSEEGFFKPLRNVVDDLKIKGSYGVVGNTDIYDYASKSFYSSYNYGINGTYGLAQIADPNLKWESSEKYSIGFNARLLDRISVDFDYYYTKSSDLILDVPQSPSKGIPGNIITTNAGKMKNSGIELTVSADVIRNSQFTWETSFNITTNKNKVISLADGVENILKGDNGGLEITNITVPGKSIGRLYLYPTAGVDPKSGRRVFITPEGDRTLLMFEKGGWFYEDGTEYAGEFEPVDCGNTLPTWYGGWTNNFKYKGFDLSLFFQFSGGNKIYNGTKASVSDMRYWNNSKDVYKKYWTPERTHAEYPMPIYGDNYSNGSALPISDLVERGDYLRLKNVSLGYTFNTKNWSKAVGISALRLYVQAQNLFVITGYSGMDPETLTNVESATLSGGTDKNTLPQARTYTIGVNLTF